MATAHIETSGYFYEQWRDRFCPTDLPERGWPDAHTERFSTVELDVTFDRLPGGGRDAFVEYGR